MTKIISAYWLIGIILELVINGKKTIDELKYYGVFTSLIGTVIIGFFNPVASVCGFVWGIYSRLKK